MVRFNTLCIFYALVIYYVRIVSCNVLDLNNLDNPKFYTIKIVEQGVTKIMILSTPENKITEIHRGRLLIWSPDPGEYVKCVTVFIFHWSGKVLINFEIENPRKTDMYYLHKYYSHFKYINKREFENEYRSLLLIEKELESEIRKHKSIGETDLGFKPKKLRRLIEKIKDSEEPIKHTQPTELETTEPEDLDPETIHFEVSSDEEPTQQTETPTQELEPETITVEISSDEEVLDGWTTDGDTDYDYSVGQRDDFILAPLQVINNENCIEGIHKGVPYRTYTPPKGILFDRILSGNQTAWKALEGCGTNYVRLFFVLGIPRFGFFRLINLLDNDTRKIFIIQSQGELWNIVHEVHFLEAFYDLIEPLPSSSSSQESSESSTDTELTQLPQ